VIIHLEHTSKAPFRVSGTLSMPKIVYSEQRSPIKVYLQTIDVDPVPKIWSGKIIIQGYIESVGPGGYEGDAHAAKILPVESIPFEFSLEFDISSTIPSHLYKYQVLIRIEDVLSQLIIHGYSEVMFSKTEE
jgi:hypothetical protein